MLPKTMFGPLEVNLQLKKLQITDDQMCKFINYNFFNLQI